MPRAPCNCFDILHDRVRAVFQAASNARQIGADEGGVDYILGRGAVSQLARHRPGVRALATPGRGVGLETRWSFTGLGQQERAASLTALLRWPVRPKVISRRSWRQAIGEAGTLGATGSGGRPGRMASGTGSLRRTPGDAGRRQQTLDGHKAAVVRFPTGEDARCRSESWNS